MSYIFVVSALSMTVFSISWIPCVRLYFERRSAHSRISHISKKYGKTMEIYTFDKSLQERMTEYTDILWNDEKIIPASQIQSEWACDTEIVIEPVGWHALWNIPRSACEEFQIRYPTVVKVEVLSVDCSSLCALVKIIAVQDDIHLPEKHNVNLIELHPTIKQENTALDIVGTSHCIDKLRFFYNHLWMPWDQDDDENADWVEEHLESRIRLAYDIKRGIIDKETCDLIRSLIKEGKEIEKKITMLEATISDEEDAHQEIADEACQLMKLHLRLQQIKSEMEVLENPVMREMLIKSQSSVTGKIMNKDRKNVGYLVWLDGTAKELEEIGNKVQKMVPENLPIRVCGYLDEALHTSETNDIILLNEGDHPIKGSSGLEEGGTIRGICDREKTVLCPKETEGASALLDFSGAEVCLENVCVEVGELQIGIIVRKGTVRVKNCRIRIRSHYSPTVKFGTVIMPGAKLIIENSIFEGFATAVVICAAGNVVMNNCGFLGCLEGIQLSDNSNITATDTLFEGFEDCAIRMETHKYLHGKEKMTETSELNRVSDSEYPNIPSIPEIVLKNCKFLNNGGDFTSVPKGTAALKERDPSSVDI